MAPQTQQLPRLTALFASLIGVMLIAVGAPSPSSGAITSTARTANAVVKASTQARRACKKPRSAACSRARQTLKVRKRAHAAALAKPAATTPTVVAQPAKTPVPASTPKAPAQVISPAAPQSSAVTTAVPSPVTAAPAQAATVPAAAPTTSNPAPATATATTTTASAANTGARSAAWSPLGEPGVGGRVTAISPSPLDPSRVLVGGDMLGVGLSTDAGAHWEPTFGFSSWEINDFTWHPTDAKVVWVGTLSGPYRSDDGGKTWQARRQGMPTGDYPYSAPIQKVLIDPADTKHLIAVGGNQRDTVKAVTGALNFGRVYESRDGGDNWSTVGSVGADLNVRDIVSAARGLEILYAATSQGVMKSVDTGRTWSLASTGLPGQMVTGLAIDPSDGNSLWASLARSPGLIEGLFRPGGIYRTTDGGRNWTASNDGLAQRVSAVASSASGMASIYRAGDGTLYTADQSWWSPTRFVSTDNGRSWRAANGNVDRFFPSAAAPVVWGGTADGKTVYGGSYDGIIASSDHGASWSGLGAEKTSDGNWRGTGYSGLLGTRAQFSSARRGVMLTAGFDSGNVLRTTTGGASWTRPTASWDNFDGGYDTAFGGSNDDVAYAVLGQAGIFNGIARSADNGATWKVAVGGGLPARGAAGATSQGSVAISSRDGAKASVVLPDGKLYRTVDGGVSWTADALGRDVRAVAADPASGAVFAATDRGVFASQDGGAFSLMSGSPQKLTRLVLSSRGELYGVGAVAAPVSRSGLWRYAKGSWTQLSTQRYASDVAIDPTNPDRIALATNDNPYHDTTLASGVWVSTDGGVTFAQRNAGLAMTRVLSVAFDPFDSGRLVAGTNGGGFWQMRL